MQCRAFAVYLEFVRICGRFPHRGVVRIKVSDARASVVGRAKSSTRSLSTTNIAPC